MSVEIFTGLPQAQNTPKISPDGKWVLSGGGESYWSAVQTPNAITRLLGNVPANKNYQMGFLSPLQVLTQEVYNAGDAIIWAYPVSDLSGVWINRTQLARGPFTGACSASHGYWSANGPNGIFVNGQPFTPTASDWGGWAQSGMFAAYTRKDSGYQTARVDFLDGTSRFVDFGTPVAGQPMTGMQVSDLGLTFSANFLCAGGSWVKVGTNAPQRVNLAVLEANGVSESVAQVVEDAGGQIWVSTWNPATLDSYLRPLGSQLCVSAMGLSGYYASLTATATQLVQTANGVPFNLINGTVDLNTPLAPPLLPGQQPPTEPPVILPQQSGTDRIVSKNGLYQTVMQEDGNLVVYRVSDMRPLWNSQTSQG